MTTHRTIETLLAELFQADELRRFLMKLEGGSCLLDELPSKDVSNAAFAHEVARLLERRGEIGPVFFSLLERERPRQARRISEFSIGFQNGWLRGPSSIASREDGPSKKWARFCILLVVFGVAVFGVSKILAWSARRGDTQINACSIMCSGCPGFSRAWAFLSTGEEVVVETDGNRLVFQCLPHGAHVVVFVEVMNGSASVDILSASITLDAGMVQVDMDKFAPGIPGGFTVVGGVPRRRPHARYETLGGEGDGPTTSSSAFEEVDEIVIIPEGDSVAPGRPEDPESAPYGIRGKEVDCKAIRRATIAAREHAVWKKVIQLTGGPCWNGYPQGLELRVHALKEFGDFKNCIKIGAESKDAKVQKHVAFCRRRLDL